MFNSNQGSFKVYEMFIENINERMGFEIFGNRLMVEIEYFLEKSNINIDRENFERRYMIYFI